MYKTFESLCYTPETNLTSYIDCTSKLKKKKILKRKHYLLKNIQIPREKFVHFFDLLVILKTTILI